MNMFMLPELWLVLFVVFGPGVELFPSLRAFRAEQSKHPRFTDIPGHRRAKLWLIPAWIVPMISMVMTAVCVLKGIHNDSARNLLVAIAMMPIVMCGMVIIQNVSGEERISWKSLLLLGSIIMQIGSVATTAIFYIGLCYSEATNLKEYARLIGELTLASCLCLSAVFIIVGAVLVVTKKVRQDPAEGALAHNARLALVFNPILSPITIPAFVIVMICRPVWQWMCKAVIIGVGRYQKVMSPQKGAIRKAA